MQTQVVEPKAHAGNGGLRGHSIGDQYPYLVMGRGSKGGNTYYPMDCRTGNKGRPRRTYKAAEIEIYALKIRNRQRS